MKRLTKAKKNVHRSVSIDCRQYINVDEPCLMNAYATVNTATAIFSDIWFRCCHFWRTPWSQVFILSAPRHLSWMCIAYGPQLAWHVCSSDYSIAFSCFSPAEDTITCRRPATLQPIIVSRSMHARDSILRRMSSANIHRIETMVSPGRTRLHRARVGSRRIYL